MGDRARLLRPRPPIEHLITRRRIYTLMHDPRYRANVSAQNATYNQPPHTSFPIGDGMREPPRPNITVR